MESARPNRRRTQSGDSRVSAARRAREDRPLSIVFRAGFGRHGKCLSRTCRGRPRFPEARRALSASTRISRTRRTTWRCSWMRLASPPRSPTPTSAASSTSAKQTVSISSRWSTSSENPYLEFTAAWWPMWISEAHPCCRHEWRASSHRLARVFTRRMSFKTPMGESLHVVHRDVSAENLFVTYNGATQVVDFGIAHARQRVHHTEAGQVKGTFPYMAPEQMTAAVVDRRVDIWALGAVLWELLTLRRLFLRDTDVNTMYAVLSGEIRPPSDCRSDVPTELDEIVLKALQRNPNERWQSTREMGKALRRCLANQEHLVGPAEIAEWMTALFPSGESRKRQLMEIARTTDTSIASDPPQRPGDQSGRRRRTDSGDVGTTYAGGPARTRQFAGHGDRRCDRANRRRSRLAAAVASSGRTRSTADRPHERALEAGPHDRGPAHQSCLAESGTTTEHEWSVTRSRSREKAGGCRLTTQRRLLTW